MSENLETVGGRGIKKRMRDLRASQTTLEMGEREDRSECGSVAQWAPSFGLITNLLAAQIAQVDVESTRAKTRWRENQGE